MLTVPEVITTPGLTLRRIAPGDATAIFHAYSSHLDAARYMTFPVARSISDTQAFVDSSITAWDQRLSHQFVITAAHDQIIGGCGFEQVIPGTNRHLSFGYCLSPREWNRGYATEVASAFRTHLASADGVYRLSATVDVDNPASSRVLEKAGYTYEGTLQRWAIHPNISSEPRDVRIYAAVR